MRIGSVHKGKSETYILGSLAEFHQRPRPPVDQILSKQLLHETLKRSPCNRSSFPRNPAHKPRVLAPHFARFKRTALHYFRGYQTR